MAGIRSFLGYRYSSITAGSFGEFRGAKTMAGSVCTGGEMGSKGSAGYNFIYRALDFLSSLDRGS